MRLLYHQPLDPLSRKVRLVLSEKKLEFALREEPVWEWREEFLRLNPAGEVPVLVEENGKPLADDVAICDYLEETWPDVALAGNDALERAEVRRLSGWFDRKFMREVTGPLVGEKIQKRLERNGAPDSTVIRAGKQNITYHLEYIGYLLEHRNWLGGDTLTMADVSAAAQVSCVDYLGDVPWHDYPEARNWYARFKSRPSMRPILTDRSPSLRAALHYDNLDF